MNKSWLSKLKKLWESRLADSGFVSVETPSQRLKTFEADKFAELSALQYQATADYYANAYKHAHQFNFSSAIERNIWMLHANGKSVRSIATQLRISTYQAAQVIEKHRKIVRTKTASKVLQFNSKGSK